LAFSPVGSLLATCAEDGTVRLWDRCTGSGGVRTGDPGAFGGPVRALAFTTDGGYLATANANGTLCLLRVDRAARREGPASRGTPGLALAGGRD
jgi:WD40 repeat protein